MSLSDFSSNLSKVSQRKFLSIFCSGIAVVALAIVASADESKRPGWNSFPANLGSFHQVGPITVADKESLRQSLKLIPDAPTDVHQVFVAETTYESSASKPFIAFRESTSPSIHTTLHGQSTVSNFHYAQHMPVCSTVF